MDYRVRDIHGDYVYRKSIASVIKHASTKGSIVSEREYRFDGWRHIGATFMGQYHEGKDFVNAFKLSQAWTYNSYDWKYSSLLSFKNILKKGEVRFPEKFCGLDNAMSAAKCLRAVAPGSDHFTIKKGKHGEGEYHYVVTPYGRELAELVQRYFILTPQTT